ncbi:hypothetical protein KPP03845_200265 (plasmid) [Streptomyces xanthophaeus]|nr:hypothetical protein KPP03845_200265 [Streptomyces xanthophaeus]
MRIQAALAARPIRARAVEPDAPTPWNMIVCPDGAVVDVAEHPAPPAAAAPPVRPATPDTPAASVLPDLLVSVPKYREMWAAV